MAIYQPPKNSNAGSTLSGIGAGLSAVGGIASVIPGGQLIGGIAAGVGAITNMIGANIEKENEHKLQAYEHRYNTIVEGEQNQQQSAENVQNMYKFNQSGVSGSVKAINEMINPTTSNKGIASNRLI